MAGAGIKVINKRIRSVKSTQQITKAMKMVSAAKLRRSQERLMHARPYATKLRELLQRMAGAGKQEHPLFAQREAATRLYVVATSDKGLCGAYNMNVMRVPAGRMDADVRRAWRCRSMRSAARRAITSRSATTTSWSATTTSTARPATRRRVRCRTTSPPRS